MAENTAFANKGYAELQEVWEIDTSNLSTESHSTLTLQKAFLLAYSQCGTIAKAAEIVDINRSTAFRWRQNDSFRFKERFLQAQAAYCDVLENKAHELAMGLEPGQNSLILVTLLNANLPDKYRPNAVLPSETMTETLQAMKQATREFKKLEDGTETVTETETTLVVKKGLI